jgi:hypothetical protein
MAKAPYTECNLSFTCFVFISLRILKTVFMVKEFCMSEDIAFVPSFLCRHPPHLNLIDHIQTTEEPHYKWHLNYSNQLR